MVLETCLLRRFRGRTSQEKTSENGSEIDILAGQITPSIRKYLACSGLEQGTCYKVT